MRSGEKHQGLEVCLIDPEGRAALDNVRVFCRRSRGQNDKPDEIVPGTSHLRDDIVWRAMELSGYRCQACGCPVFSRAGGPSQ